MDDFDNIPAAVEEVEDALTKFNREWEVKLNAKRESENKASTKALAEATEEMQDWNKQREVRLNAKKEANRNEESVFVETLESSISGPAWDRVMKLVDANADAASSGKSDVTRMRNLFIQLKNDKGVATN